MSLVSNGISIVPLRGTVGAVITATDHHAIERAIRRTLGAVPPCPDSPEPGRACIACEAHALRKAMLPETPGAGHP
jgi:hypothetical protein